MKVHHDEGVAIHIGPEHVRWLSVKTATKRRQGRASGQPLSRERSYIRSADAVPARKATRSGAPSRAPGRPGVVGDPGMCGRSLYGNREISGRPAADRRPGPHREGDEPKPAMHGVGSQTPP